MAEELGNPSMVSQWCCGLGDCHARMDRLGRSIECYEQGLAKARDAGDTRWQGFHLGRLGNTFMGIGKPVKAVAHYRDALKIAREVGDRQAEGRLLLSLGKAHGAAGAPETGMGAAVLLHRPNSVGGHVGSPGCPFAAAEGAFVLSHAFVTVEHPWPHPAWWLDIAMVLVMYGHRSPRRQPPLAPKAREANALRPVTIALRPSPLQPASGHVHLDSTRRCVAPRRHRQYLRDGTRPQALAPVLRGPRSLRG